MIKNLKKNQVVIFVIALMLITAGYLNFANEQNKNLIPTSALADSEQMASIGDATLVNANQVSENNIEENIQENVAENSNTEENLSSNSQSVANGSNNIQNNETSNKADKQIVEDEYFAQSRLDRDNMYSQTLENYQKILETSNLSNEDKELAQSEIKRINNEKNAIMIAENLIKTKNFEDVIIFVNNGNVSVIVKSKELNESQIAQIQNIIIRELNVKVSKINVSSK